MKPFRLRVVVERTSEPRPTWLVFRDARTAILFADSLGELPHVRVNNRVLIDERYPGNNRPVGLITDHRPLSAKVAADALATLHREIESFEAVDKAEADRLRNHYQNRIDFELVARKVDALKENHV